MRTAVTLLLALALQASSSSCSADDAMMARTVRNQQRIQSYRGVLAETGVLGSGEMRSEVLFKRPYRFLSRVLAPASYAGVSLAFDGQSFVLYYPNARYAIVFEHLAPPTSDEQRRIVADAYRHGRATYEYDLGASGHVAGLPVVTLQYTARRKGFIHPTGSLQIYDQYSFPLAGEMSFGGDARYAFRFQQMTFNCPLDDSLFALPLPDGTVVSRWDLTAAGVSEAQMRTEAGFQVALPARMPPGFALDRIVRLDGPVAAYTAIYRRAHHFLLVSLFRDMGLRPASEEHGVPVEVAGRRGRLVLNPVASTYAFAQHGTSYIVTSNLPFEEMLAAVSELR
jgi:outer membrane lipoprotein-sorting protein